MEKSKIFYGGEQVGLAEVTQDGLFTVLKCSSTYYGDIMRLYGWNGDYVPIGIMMPSKNCLKLVKKFTRNDLHTVPLDSFTRFEIFPLKDGILKAESGKNEEQPKETEPPKVVEEAETEEQPIAIEEHKSPWQAIDDPSELFVDEELKETASSIKEGLVANDGDTTLFAIPISTEKPFPLMPVFRYGSSAMVEGKCCIVFKIKDGQLI